MENIAAQKQQTRLRVPGLQDSSMNRRMSDVPAPLQIRQRLVSTQTDYSIVSTPFSTKNGKEHTMTKPLQPQRSHHMVKQQSSTAKPVTVFDVDAVAAPSNAVVDLETPANNHQKYSFDGASKRVEIGAIGKSDAATQVFTRDQVPRYQAMRNQDQCEFAGCTNMADAGSCNYRVCLSKGCQRNVCALHIVEADPEIDDDAFNTDNRVCHDCETRANRAFWLAICLLIGVPIMAALPAIFLYGSQEVL